MRATVSVSLYFSLLVAADFFLLLGGCMFRV